MSSIYGLIKIKKITTYDDLMKSCDIGLSTVMIKRKLLLRNKFLNLKTKEDYQLWLNLIKKDIKIFGLNKNLVFWSFPTVLVIDIKRYNSKNKKQQILIDFPLENLDLTKYVIGYNKESYIYDLYGVCNHSGSVLGGHYTSFVKNANGKWYHFDDTNVTEVTNTQQIISPKAYCFFYRKRV
jgi:uncharacterized UBP type Zn finger protein